MLPAWWHSQALPPLFPSFPSSPTSSSAPRPLPLPPLYFSVFVSFPPSLILPLSRVCFSKGTFNTESGEFPGSPVVRALCLHCRGLLGGVRWPRLSTHDHSHFLIIQSCETSDALPILQLRVWASENLCPLPGKWPRRNLHTNVKFKFHCFITCLVLH